MILRHGTIGVLLFAAACKDAPPPAAEVEATPPEIVVTSARSDLVFSYRDPDTGQLATTASIGAIPEAARTQVVVTDLSLTPEERKADRYLYLADLRTPRADGSYPVAIASRYSFDLKGGGEGAAGDSKDVVVYTTAWCGVCKKTKSLLRSLGVPFVEKDVEASKSAAQELAAKAQRAGINAGGVPVIDVAGTMMQGLDEPTLRRVLKEKGLLR